MRQPLRRRHSPRHRHPDRRHGIPLSLHAGSRRPKPHEGTAEQGQEGEKPGGEGGQRDGQVGLLLKVPGDRDRPGIQAVGDEFDAQRGSELLPKEAAALLRVGDRDDCFHEESGAL